MAVNRQFYRQEDVVGQECFLCHNKILRKDWDNELWSHLTSINDVYDCLVVGPASEDLIDDVDDDGDDEM